jgi:hypothetical protein
MPEEGSLVPDADKLILNTCFTEPFPQAGVRVQINLLEARASETPFARTYGATRAGPAQSRRPGRSRFAYSARE